MLERDLSKLLEGTADAAFAVNEQGLICSWNRAAEKLFGYPASEVLQKPCAQLFQGRTTFGAQVCGEPCTVIDCALLNREIPNYDMEVKGRSGRKIWVNVSILVFHDERTNHHLVAHLARDIGARKRSEDLSQKLVQIAKEISSLPGDASPLPPVSPLTDQERRVLQILAEGKNPAAVARELGISPRTLRNHIHHVNQKLRTHNRLEAVIQASRRGLI